jgi:hypothetical protein
MNTPTRSALGRVASLAVALAALASSAQAQPANWSAGDIVSFAPSGIFKWSAPNYASPATLYTPPTPVYLNQNQVSQADLLGEAFDPQGNLYLADAVTGHIVTITPTGVETVIGTIPNYNAVNPNDGASSQPNALAIGPSGEVYCLDGANGVIYKFAKSGTTWTTSTFKVLLGGNAGANVFSPLSGIVVDSRGNVYVGDWNTSLIIQITPAGVEYDTWANPNTIHPLYYPKAFSIDAAGNMYVSSGLYPEVMKFAATSDGVPGTTPQLLVQILTDPDSPFGAVADYATAGITADNNGHIFVYEQYASGMGSTLTRVLEFSSTTLNQDYPGRVRTLAFPTGANLAGGTDTYLSSGDLAIVPPFVGVGVCCRGATCNTTIFPANCTGNTNAGAVHTTTGNTCNAPGNTSTPCCYPDYNKTGGITVGDIFDFMNDWFAGSKFALVGGDGDSGTLSVQNIFDFLNAWFAGC